jgi:hypothetical protein
MSGVSGQPAPPFISFNPENRTIFGFVSDSVAAGAYRVDITFTDDIDMKAYLNLKITVLKSEQYSKSSIGWFSAVSLSIFLGSLIYMAYMYHWLSISLSLQTRQRTKKTMKR